MNNDFNNLWLLRCYPSKERRIKEFIDESIVAIGWRDLKNMEGKSKDSIASELVQSGHPSSNVTVGVINHFVNNMQVGDICLIPDDNKIYIAKIDGDYSYKENKKEAGYPHQRPAIFLNIDDPIDRYDLPEGLQKSLGAQNTVANLTHRKEMFCNFMNNVDITENDILDTDNLKTELLAMLPKALQNIKNDLESDDATRRATASIEVIKLIQKF